MRAVNRETVREEVEVCCRLVWQTVVLWLARAAAQATWIRDTTFRNSSRAAI